MSAAQIPLKEMPETKTALAALALHCTLEHFFRQYTIVFRLSSFAVCKELFPAEDFSIYHIGGTQTEIPTNFGPFSSSTYFFILTSPFR